MKVFLWPTFRKEERGEGGIRRVWEALTRWLPEYGIELVDSPHAADVVNAHADDLPTSKPVALSLHGLYWYGYDWDAWCYEANQRLIRSAKCAAAVSVPSAWVHRALARGMLLDSHILHHGIDIEDWPVGDNHNYVFWGKTRSDPVCDPHPVTELAKRFPKQNFITTYTTADLPNIQSLGPMHLKHSRPYLSDARVYLATVRETGGITVMEAAAAGVPALGFDWGVNPEIIVHKETGYLVPPDDYDALAEGLNYCMQHRDRLGAAAREHIRLNYSWAERVKDYLPFYQAAIDTVQHPVKVSIVVTAYNLEQYLPDCLNSILNQTFQDWECFIVDDASPDRCGEIADDFAARDRRFRVIHHTTNAYLAEARNSGFRHARGEYFLSLDADDRLPPNAVGLLAQEADRRRDYDIFTGAFELVEPDGRTWISGWPPSDPSFERQIRHQNQVPYNSLYRRWVWERSGGYRRRYRTAEDADFWTRAMSYGARPAKVTDAVTLTYSNRPSSMSHVQAQVDWTAWSSWSQFKKLTPFGAAAASDDPDYARIVHAYGPPEVSVVIPCGPGHERFLQDVLDSLVAQTFLNWEAIVVNDTGKSWYRNGKLVCRWLAGFPFVHVVEAEDHKNRGVSWARNAGITAATAERFVLFDADDYMQPLFLDAVIRVHEKMGGWVYTDWYDQNGEVKEGRSWDHDEFLVRMLGPVTGLYTKQMWEAAGGFDEQTDLWEDYSWQLSLYEQGYCGTRVTMPLFTYRYDTGKRREDNFARQKEALQYIKNKHTRLFEDREVQMACRKCGGGGGSNASVSAQTASSGSAGDMVLMEYVGTATQTMHLRSHVNPKVQYKFGGQPNTAERKFYVYAGDVEWMTAMPLFKVAPRAMAEVSIAVAPAPLVAAPVPAGAPSIDDSPIGDLPVEGEIVSILSKTGIMTVGQLKKLSPTDLTAIKGMGRARVRKVLDAIASYAA